MPSLTYISFYDITHKAGIAERTAKRAVANNEYITTYISGVGRGGRQLRIALESLPQAAQDRYHGIERERSEAELAQFSNEQRHRANEKKGCVHEYWRSGFSPAEFVTKRNASGEYAPITEAQLYAWQRIIKNGGDIAELVDKRGMHRAGTGSLQQEAWDDFYALYMTQQQRTAKWCWKQTKKRFPDIPSVKTFQRRVQEIPYYAIKLYREGETAFRDALPSMQRSRLDIDSNDVWFSDHHLFDVFVRNKRGKAARLWLTAFFDARSNMLVGWLIRDADPNATAVKQCFRRGVEGFGVPKEVYFDNGKDYKSRDFHTDYPHSLVSQLGINTIYATKYHGQAKTVERFFGTLEQSFGKMWETYCGKDSKLRPECMRISNAKIAEIAPTMDEFIATFKIWLNEYHNTESRGQDMNGKSPNRVYTENLKLKRIVSDTDTLRILCGNVTPERTVHKNGISVMNNFYYSDTLLQYVGQKVIALYDPENIDEVAVFDTEHNAICMAKAKCITAFRHTTEEEYKRAAKEKKAARAIALQCQPGRSLTVQELIARDQLLQQCEEEQQNAPQAEQLPAKAMRNAETLRRSTQQSNDTEDSITAVLYQHYLKIAGG